MEGDLHIASGHRFDHRPLGAQLGLLDHPDGNSVLHEVRFALQHQAECFAVGPAVLRHDGDELAAEPARRLAEQPENPQSRVLAQTFQHDRALGTDVRADRVGLRHIARSKRARCCACDHRCWHQRCDLSGFPNQPSGLGS